LSVESGSVSGILESYSTDALKEKLSKLDALLKSVDARSKQPIIFSKFSNRASNNPKHFCADCGKRLKTHGATRCSSCNMRLVGKNHVETRKKKGGS
jgi:tRNA(Ile2) C34 agmatinyltransferase TiaS